MTLSTNIERTGKRDSASFDTFLTELSSRRPELGAVRNVLYQYCDQCQPRIRGVRLFLTSEYTTDTAIFRKALTGGRAFTYVEHIDPYTWSVTAHDLGENSEVLPTSRRSTSAEDFIAWKAEHMRFPGHTCSLPANLVDVNKLSTHEGDTSTRALLSTLARCVQDASPIGGMVETCPVRDLDLDTVLVNRRTGNVVAIIEETSRDMVPKDIPSRMRVLNNKVSAMSEMLAQHTGATFIKIAGFAPTGTVSNDALSEVRSPNESLSKRYTSYGDLLNWCVSSLD
jgi:hypothetical protein